MENIHRIHRIQNADNHIAQKSELNIVKQSTLQLFIVLGLVLLIVVFPVNAKVAEVLNEQTNQDTLSNISLNDNSSTAMVLTSPINPEINRDKNLQNGSNSKEVISYQVDYAFYLNANERYDEAIVVCNEILENKSDDWSALSMKGWAQLGLNQTEGALSTLEQSLTLNPHNPLALSNKACALYALGRCEEVLQTLDIADSLDPLNDLNKELRKLADTCP